MPTSYLMMVVIYLDIKLSLGLHPTTELSVKEKITCSKRAIKCMVRVSPMYGYVRW